MIYLNVKLLNDAVDKSTADIVPHQTKMGVVYSIYSDNIKLKNHLEKLLTYPAFIPAPGRNDPTFFADSGMELMPNSIYYLNALPEILAWRGYNVTIKQETHKSLDFLDFILLDTVKSNLPDGIIYNSSGERVVKYVPQGYVAVHQDGRTVAGGKFLNANIDKEGASWTLVENPHEQASPEQRAQVKEYMDVGLEDYHPGVEEDAYVEREEGQPHFKIQQPSYTPQGVSLADYYKNIQPQPQKEDSSNIPTNYPAYLEPGNVVYSPQTGQAFDSKFWPPAGIDYANYDWYVFSPSGLSDENKALYAPIMGLTPALIVGVESGIVTSETNLDVSGGFKINTLINQTQNNMSLNSENNSGIFINQPAIPKLEVMEMREPEWLKSYGMAKDKLQKLTSLTQGSVNEGLEGLEIDGLRGSQASFRMGLYPYQKAIVSAMTTPEQYEIFGGPKGWHGYFLNVKMGLGKTAMVSAANAIMRNRGLIKNGTQTTIVTAPNKNVYVWQTEVGKFLGEHSVVIDGDKQTRVAQWEDILDKARSGELPSFIIVGSSKFRYVKGDADDDEQDAWELDLDAKYMKLLSLGGKSASKEVMGGHVGALVVDESGQYVNPDSARHSALKNIVEGVYGGKGIVWTLNGNISGNSATDTISELSFINKFVRDSYLPMVQEYTKTNTESRRESKSMGRRVWKDHNRLRDFFYTFGTQIYSLSGETVAGEDFGLMRTEDELTPLGREWGSVYFDAEKKLINAQSSGLGNRAMGLLSILINSGYGSVAPARLMEYELGTRKILDEVRERMTSDEFQTFKNSYLNFLNKATELNQEIGRIPAKDLTIAERDEFYLTSFSEGHRDLIELILDSWECPYTDSIVNSITTDFQQLTPTDRPLKIGIAGFSKISVNKIAKRLRDRYAPSTHLIQVVDGSVTPKDVNAIQTRHQTENERNVITLVTGAGAFGLSLPSDRTYRSAMWNSATGLQFDGRFHRKAEQKNLNTVVLPMGVNQYMRELELRKGNMAASATNTLLEVDDEGDELVINSNSVSRFLDKLAQYRPKIIERGN